MSGRVLHPTRLDVLRRDGAELVAEYSPVRAPLLESARDSGARSGRPVADRYEEGYADGYRAGRADGMTAARRRPQPNGHGALPLDRKDLRWLVGLAHPDKHATDKSVLRATRITQWLNELLDASRKDP